jgi:penicillin-binding protein 1C
MTNTSTAGSAGAGNPKADDIETAALPGDRGEPTIRAARVPTGATPTARVPRTVPPPQRPGYVPPSRKKAPSRPPRRSRGGSGGGWPAWQRRLASALFGVVAVVVLLFFVAASGGVVGYVYIASQLPSPSELRARSAHFVSSKILDREGNLLYEVTDPQGGRRTWVDLEEISPFLVQATLAAEDRNFYSQVHRGVDPIAILRAIYYNVTEQRIVSGASTIPQQLARLVLLTPEERAEVSMWRKIKEGVLAAELARTYTKDEMLEIYLNEIYYGGLAYGIQAASDTYFGVDAADLTIAQASFLAGLPQLPSLYDPFVSGPESALARQLDVLGLMIEDEYITPSEADEAAAEMADYEFQAPNQELTEAPHFVFFVRQVLESDPEFGPEALYRNEEGRSLRIYTTLDPRLQALAEETVREGVAGLVERDATNGALVALDPSNGQILAMVGSADYHNEEIDGQVNVAIRCRQPGSSIKPLNYVAALELGWTPSTLIWDVETEFPDGANPPYVPVNYDGRYRGPMLLRDALANSLNVPAVKTLEFVGVEGLLEMATRLGVRSLADPAANCPEYPADYTPAYGLSLTLGGGEVKLVEMAGAYAVFANGGLYLEPSPILRIEDSEGQVLRDNSGRPGERALSAQHAYLMTHILSDTKARCQTFRCPSLLELSDRPAAAKTGTTDDYRDGWTIGYTPDLVTAVWVGNSDNSPMDRLPGSAGAGPIWHEFMEAAHEGLAVSEFQRPPGIEEIEICADCGTLPTGYCTRRKTEIFAEDQPPLDENHCWYRLVTIDALTGLRANETCSGNTYQSLMLAIDEEEGWLWAQGHLDLFGGLQLAPVHYCGETPTGYGVSISQPEQGSSVHGSVQVIGTVMIPSFESYYVMYGAGAEPAQWRWVSGPHLAPVQEGLLTEWHTGHLEPGTYSLLIVAKDTGAREYQARVRVSVGSP